MVIFRYVYVHSISWCAGRTAPPCENNPNELVCTCKGFRNVGICSHVLVINDWYDEGCDVTGLLMDLSGGKIRKPGGYAMGVRPALTKEKAGKGPTKKTEKNPNPPPRQRTPKGRTHPNVLGRLAPRRK